MNHLRNGPVWKRCDRDGIAAVRVILKSEIGSIERDIMNAWLEDAERSERLAVEKRALDISERNAIAAETSAAAAMESAKTSGTSARAAIFAAVVSFFALVVAIAAYFRQ